MKRIVKYICGAAFLILLGEGLAAPLPADVHAAWPYPVPCRIQDGTNGDLFVMTLGDVATPLADGVFDPAKDQVTLQDGSVKSNYYRDVLGVKFYQPLDKSHFPLPPSGWCTWYYYYNRITAVEAKRNAKWIADNLKPYGAQYVQIDDGWQGAGGRGGQRDWTTVNPDRFPGGMADLAAYIRSLGLKPGLWLAPHGQSNPDVVKTNQCVFLLRPGGASASDTWEGSYLVDPTGPESAAYLKNLFTKLAGWGFDYFKIDGQPIVVDEYSKRRQFMKNPSDGADELYRKTLAPIRAAIGPDRYLLGCWGLPIEGAGIMNGSRTGGDIVLGWGGFQVALRPTMEYYYLHNIVWYSDPDVLLVRSPLTLEQARVWATLEGLTGQALMSSDRLPDLSQDRVELMRRVYPAVDIRPLDLFPSKKDKGIWDLKVNHLGRHYDVVGVFNFQTDKSKQTMLKWSELGLPDDKPVHVFDFWNQEYLGEWGQGMAVPLAPTSCRVLTLLPDNGRIQLISTSRHITQGWVDLMAMKQNDTGDRFTGTSQGIAGDAYELRFVFPRGTNCAIKEANVHAGLHRLPVEVFNHQGWAAVRWTPAKTSEVKWDVSFVASPATVFHFPPSAPVEPHVERAGLDGVKLTWEEQYYLNCGYQVYLNGHLLGYTPSASFPIRNLNPQSDYTAVVKCVTEDGRESPQGAQIKFSPAAMAPAELALNTLEPVRSTGRWRGFEIGDLLPDAPILLGGKRYEAGVGAFAGSEIEFDVKGLYDKFTALVGLDAVADNRAAVEFVVFGDGSELWRSSSLKKSDTPQAVDVKITGVHKLVLRSSGGATAGNSPQVDWAEAKVSKTKN